MGILRLVVLWVLSFIFTSIIDVIWHLVIFGKLYSQGIKPLARMSGDNLAFKAFPGILSQVLVVTCIVFLVLYKAQKGNFLEGALIGACAGVLAITVYGVTNYALFKDWGQDLTILEVVWGPILGGLSGIFVAWTSTFILK
ncbi:MAG: DUF2177 family protein [Candidatus Aminicenantaceae bacterium]